MVKTKDKIFELGLDVAVLSAQCAGLTLQSPDDLFNSALEMMTEQSRKGFVATLRLEADRFLEFAEFAHGDTSYTDSEATTNEMEADVIYDLCDAIESGVGVINGNS